MTRRPSRRQSRAIATLFGLGPVSIDSGPEMRQQRTRYTRQPSSGARQLDGIQPDRSGAAVTRPKLTTEDVDAVAKAAARRIVEITGAGPPTFGLVGPREPAADIGASLDHVYAHAAEVCALPLGSGPKARIRFDLDRVRRALGARTLDPVRRGRRPKLSSTAHRLCRPRGQSVIETAVRPRARGRTPTRKGIAPCGTLPRAADRPDLAAGTCKRWPGRGVPGLRAGRCGCR
jgi:hypothetical protein